MSTSPTTGASITTTADIRARIAACVAAGDPTITRCADDLYAVLDEVDRRLEAICPPWCAGHTGTYQGWENMTAGGQLRNHAEEGAQVGGASVIVLQTERDDHTLEAPIVELYVDHLDVADLSPGQARELAAVLVEAAQRAEAQS